MNTACTRCHRSFERTYILYQQEQTPCEVLFVRMAPSAHEDQHNSMFAHSADLMLVQALQESSMVDVPYGYSYLLRCWSGHSPYEEDMATCVQHHLLEEIRSRGPVMIVLLDEAVRYVNTVYEILKMPIVELRLHPEKDKAIQQMNGIFRSLDSARSEKSHGT